VFLVKILYLHQYFNTNENSGGTRSYEFSNELTKAGHEVVVITGKKTDQSSIKNERLKVISTNTKYSNDMGFLRRVLSFFHYILFSIILSLKVKNIDVVFATSTPITIGVPGYIISKLKRAKFIFEVRDVWPDVPIELGFINNKALIYLLKKYELFIYKHADYIIALSKGMKNNILSKGNFKNKLSVITNLANLEMYNNIEIDEKKIKKNYGLENKFICIHPGTMGFVNGLDFILDTANYTKEIEEVHYLLIGSGKEKDKLKTRVKKENLKNVTIADPLPKKDIIKVIKASDLGLMVVRNDFKILEDNSANKFFDFLAAGLPILINYEGWQKETLENNEAGFSTLTSKEMADKIIYLNNNRTLRDNIAKNSKDIAEKYSKKNACNKLLDIIENRI
jgi:glycosyltransferase involved in cell wall biosynthesis